MNVKVSDFIARKIADHGVKHVFLLTGGGAMHLNDAFGRCKDLEVVCLHHEQAAAMAAESYFRLTNLPAALNVTTGPGGINAINGVFGAWVDSLAMIVISGQVRTETLVRSTDLPLRQLGDQEVDIVRMVDGITKYAQVVMDPSTVRYHVEKALYLATHGRPGPVWLDVPMNVQGAMIDPSSQRGFDPTEIDTARERTLLKAAVSELHERLAQAKRPVILAGSGVGLANARGLFVEFAERLGVPVTTAWNSHDLIWNDHPQYVGRPGTIGDRAGNFAVQNADLLLVLGSRLNIRQISYSWHYFAREAFKVIVDVDPTELKKPTVKADLAICADVKEFMAAYLTETASIAPASHGSWLAWCRERKERYPTVPPSYWEREAPVNPYCFVDALFQQLPEDQIVVTGDGTACVATFQAAFVKRGQRLYTNSGCASMGYDIPAAIGAAVASGGEKVVCIAGDGSLQQNLQELQSILGLKLSIKLFVLNNNGYHSIRQTQRNFFPDNVVGCGPDSGLTFPDMGKIAAAYGFPFLRVSSHAELQEAIATTLAGPEAKICEIMIDPDQQFAPKVSSKRLADGRMVTAPMEDMAPFLERQEFLSNMLIKPVD